MEMGVLCEGRLSARLHPCPMHPCQLLFLALYSDNTRIIMVLLEHEIPGVKRPAEKMARRLQWVGSSLSPCSHVNDCSQADSGTKFWGQSKVPE